MTNFFRLIAAIALVLGAASMLAGQAHAGDPEIEAAKDQGVVGERIDGFLGIVNGGADPALVRLVNDINNKRRAVYDDTAGKTGTTMEQVARVTGEKQIARADSGEFYMDDTGSWKQK